MNVIMTSRSRLADSYGERGLAEIEQALDDLLAARDAAGIPSRRYFVEQGLADMGVAGAPVEWTALVAQLAQLAHALHTRADALQSVLIIGGPRIIPFGTLPNPMLDRDLLLPADCVYGTAAGVWEARPPDAGATHFYGTDWPVGRLPDAAEPTPALLVTLIQAAADQHRRGALQLMPVLGYSTAGWQSASGRVFAEAARLADAHGQQLLLSPPVTAGTLDLARLGQARLIYCNLHGVRDGAYWYGQSVSDPALLLALRPQDLAGLDLSGAVVISEACYGAALGRNTTDSSMALMLLSRGVVAFVGATVITYGPFQPPSSESDLIAIHLLRTLCAGHTTIGAAFLSARLSTLREMVLMQGYLDEDDIKTLLVFVLYGDPTLLVRGDQSGIEAQSHLKQ